MSKSKELLEVDVEQEWVIKDIARYFLAVIIFVIHQIWEQPEIICQKICENCVLFQLVIKDETRQLKNWGYYGLEENA